MLGLSRAGSPKKDGSPVILSVVNGETMEKTRKVKFQDKHETMSVQSTNHGGSGGRQLVPGLLLVQQENSGKIACAGRNSVILNFCNSNNGFED